MALLKKSRAWKALVEILEVEGQSALARRIDVSQPTLSLIKHRKREPKAPTKVKLLRQLGIELDWWDEPAGKGAA